MLVGDRILIPAAIDTVMTITTVNLDLFGYIYAGGHDASVNAVRFIREYLGRIDTRYKEVGGLLYHLLRHGWVHRFSSKRLKLNNGKTLDFEFGFQEKREEYLALRADHTSGPRLFISVPLFCKDVLSALDLYMDDVHNNPDLAALFERAFYSRREPDEESEIRRCKYLDNSDFNFIYGCFDE